MDIAYIIPVERMFNVQNKTDPSGLSLTGDAVDIR